jgi:hypothetical protein
MQVMLKTLHMFYLVGNTCLESLESLRRIFIEKFKTFRFILFYSLVHEFICCFVVYPTLHDVVSHDNHEYIPVPLPKTISSALPIS